MKDETSICQACREIDFELALSLQDAGTWDDYESGVLIDDVDFSDRLWLSNNRTPECSLCRLLAYTMGYIQGRHHGPGPERLHFHAYSYLRCVKQTRLEESDPAFHSKDSIVLVVETRPEERLRDMNR